MFYVSSILATFEKGRLHSIAPTHTLLHSGSVQGLWMHPIIWGEKNIPSLLEKGKVSVVLLQETPISQNTMKRTAFGSVRSFGPPAIITVVQLFTNYLVVGRAMPSNSRWRRVGDKFPVPHLQSTWVRSTAVLRVMDEISLADIWRLVKPSQSSFSLDSSPRRTRSRTGITLVDVASLVISDPTPVSLRLSVRKSRMLIELS